MVWDSAIRPLLLRRFPKTSPEMLNEARSFAYGGSVIQDLGYYPFGNKFFSNLLHYVRSGDFVEALLRDARGIDEYAFALGACCLRKRNTGNPGQRNKRPLIFQAREKARRNIRTSGQAASISRVSFESLGCERCVCSDAFTSSSDFVCHGPAGTGVREKYG